MIHAAVKAANFGRLVLLLCSVLLLTEFSVPASTNDAWFTRVWKTDDGLLNNNILATAQGPDNYMWVVPSVGLMRFDGVSFSRFPLEDFTGPTDTHICTVLRGRTGVLWIATYGGMVMGLNPDLSVFTLPRNHLPTGTPLILAEDKEGALWLGYSNAVCRVQAGQAVQLGTNEGTPLGSFHSLTSDGAGNIWLAKGNQISLFRDGQFKPVAKAAAVRCMAATSTNAIWFIAGAHLLTCDTDGGLHDYGVFQALSGATRRALLQDHTGALWIGTDNDGLFRYSNTKAEFEKIETSCPSVMGITEDGKGNLWVSTIGGGLARLSLNGVQQETLDDTGTLAQVQSICEDSQRVLWGVTKQGGLISQINDEWKLVYTNAPFAGNVSCVAADLTNGIWIGTRDGKLLHLANNSYTTWVQNEMRGTIDALLPTAKGDLWILSSDVLQLLHDGQLQDVTPTPQVERFSAITEDAAGNIWVGARGLVMRYNGKEFTDETPQLPILDRTVCCLYATPDGTVWISCGGLGLLRIKDGHVGQIGVDRGLFNDFISQIVADGHGWLWFGSDHGIFKIQQRELERAIDNPGVRLRPIVYGQNEGLSSLEALFSTSSPFVVPRAICTQDGRVRLLTHTGIVMADPKIIPENYPPPPVLLTRVEVDGQIIASYGSVASTQMAANLKTLSVPLRLFPSHRHLEFEFTAFHFSAPENIHFRYQLVGFDNDWIDAGTERNANYSRLTAGHYQFRVGACIGNGPWSETTPPLAFTVTPFFWQTWWFRLVVLLLFTASVIAIVRYISTRRFQAEMRLLEQRAALDKERTRIARDLHDDLGCSLNTVALTLDMTQREASVPETVNGKIKHCSALVREVSQSVDEIVWAINPRNDTLRYMVDYISQFAVEFLQTVEIPCIMDLPDNIPNHVISPEARHNLLLVVKEALNNVIRHAHASEVHLRITAAENQVSITIDDNGCGFENAPDNARCDGLRNIRQRMEEIGGQFQLASRRGAGTQVKFLYSWPTKT